MLLEQLIFGIGNALASIPAGYYVLLLIIVGILVAIVSSIFNFHLRSYTFRDYRTGMVKLVYVAGLLVLGVTAFILLGIMFSQS